MHCRISRSISGLHSLDAPPPQSVAINMLPNTLQVAKVPPPLNKASKIPWFIKAICHSGLTSMDPGSGVFGKDGRTVLEKNEAADAAGHVFFLTLCRTLLL